MKILLLESCNLRQQISRESLIAACRKQGADVTDDADIFVIFEEGDEPIYAIDSDCGYVFWSDVLFTPTDRDLLVAEIEWYKKLQELKEAVSLAKDKWFGWDWTHDPGHCTCEHDEVPYTDSPMAPHELVAIGHTEECARKIAKDQKVYEANVKMAAERAGDLGDEMIRALESCNFATATELADAACRTEAEFGDCPVWGDIRNKLKLFIAAQEVTV
jgi:hypothetical protein